MELCSCASDSVGEVLQTAPEVLDPELVAPQPGCGQVGPAVQTPQHLLRPAALSLQTQEGEGEQGQEERGMGERERAGGKHTQSLLMCVCVCGSYICSCVEFFEVLLFLDEQL